MEKRFDRSHRYTSDDVLELVLILGDGKEMSPKDIYFALSEVGVMPKIKDYSPKESTMVNNFVENSCRNFLGKDAIKCVGVSRAKKVSLAISQDEAVERLTESKPSPEKEAEIVYPITERLEETTDIVEVVKKLSDFFKNTSNYSPSAVESLIKEVSFGFSSRSVIEAVIVSFKNSENKKLSEMHDKFLR